MTTDDAYFLGQFAGNQGHELSTCPLIFNPAELRTAWETGHSVGVALRQQALSGKALKGRLIPEDRPAVLKRALA